MKDLFYFLKDMFSIREVVNMYNEYADYIRYERINNIENINKSLAGLKPVDIINMIVYGEYNTGDDYYTFDGGGNIQTINENDIIEYIEDEVDDEEFYTFLIDNNYFSKEEYKDYLKEDKTYA